jgi:agmatinase
MSGSGAVSAERRAEEWRPVLILAPFEQTSSFMPGSAEGPEAVAEELRRVERFDPDVRQGFGRDEHLETFHVPVASGNVSDVLRDLEQRATIAMAEGRFVLTLGGEHTVTLGPLRAAIERWGSVGVVQLDAHGDLRDSYEGRKTSHACAMRRALDLGVSLLGLGIRSTCQEEVELAASNPRIAHRTPRQLRDASWSLGSALDHLPECVYLTVDMDVFDPAIAPGVGTPEAGGLDWPQVASLIDEVASRRHIVAADVLELAPRVERERTVRLAARVAVRVLLRSRDSASRPMSDRGADVVR